MRVSRFLGSRRLGRAVALAVAGVVPAPRPSSVVRPRAGETSCGVVCARGQKYLQKHSSGHFAIAGRVKFLQQQSQCASATLDELSHAADADGQWLHLVLSSIADRGVCARPPAPVFVDERLQEARWLVHCV